MSESETLICILAQNIFQNKMYSFILNIAMFNLVYSFLFKNAF